MSKFKKGGFPSEEQIVVQVDTEPDFIGRIGGEHEILSEAVQERVSAYVEKAVREIVDGLRTEQEQCKRSSENVIQDTRENMNMARVLRGVEPVGREP